MFMLKICHVSYWGAQRFRSAVGEVPFFLE